MEACETPAGPVTKLEPQGAIDIGQAIEFKKDLLRAIEAGKPITISLEQVTDLHVSAVQLLWAAMRNAEMTGLPFRRSGAVSEEVLATLRAAGLEMFLPSEEAL
jgi:anti-anti-sigma factor